eukprot:snap_masked-scaffold119_size336447-processed-gene-0.0 protein:Tk11767 transcript:snap_masked-scaffold119_size336447-processed-gene-0.0-mRNA-1 annotation:"rho-related gtp-binding protein"
MATPEAQMSILSRIETKPLRTNERVMTTVVKGLDFGVNKMDYIPTSFDKVLATQEVNKHKVDLVLWDTSGSPAYDSVRSLSYPDADVFLLCYKIADPISLQNVKTKWMPEIRRHDHGGHGAVPIILCGCQSDLRSDAGVLEQLSKVGRGPVSQEQGLGVCCEVGAVNYIETSSAMAYESRSEVHEAFELCALAFIKSGRGDLPRSPSSASSSTHKHLLNNSFGSQSDLSLPKKSGSACSSLKKRAQNISFSSSENEMAINSTVPPILEDDVFPGVSSQSRSPRLSHGDKARIRSKSQHRVSMAPTRNELAFMVEEEPAPPPLFTSTTNRSSCTAINIHSTTSQSPVSPAQAQVRANGLSRRTSFLAQTKPHGALSVESPSSPLGSVSSSSCYDLKSPVMSTHSVPTSSYEIKPNGLKVLGFESLKSHASTGSQGSTGSKTSTGSSYGSTSTAAAHLRKRGSLMPKDPSVPDTEDPELLRNLQYVSPKAGVYRPINSNGTAAGHNSSGNGGKGKKNCTIM